MTRQIAEQPVFKAVQAILKATFWLPGSRRDGVSEARPRCELLRREMAFAGDLLIDALALEHQFVAIDLRRADDEALQRWKAYRATVDRMASDYASAVARWREAVLEECQSAERPCLNVH